MGAVIRTKSPVDRVKRAVRAFYWRWRAKQASIDADMLRAAAERNNSEAESCDIAAREWRNLAMRIEGGME